MSGKVRHHPPKSRKSRKNQCGVLGQLMLTAIAVAVATIVTAGAASAISGKAFGAVLGAMTGGGPIGGVSAGAWIAGGAIGGAVGSMASQGVGVASGIQDKFSWKGVALAGIAGGIGGYFQGLGNAAGFAKNAVKAGVAGAKELGGVAGFLSAGGFTSGAARGAISSTLTQGIGVATGLQDSFSWAGVAGAAIGGGVTSHLSGKWAHPERGLSFGAGLAANAAGAIANAATRSAINGESFGRNLAAALPDVIGQAIGNAIGGALRGAGKTGASHVEAVGDAAAQIETNPSELVVPTEADLLFAAIEAERLLLASGYFAKAGPAALNVGQDALANQLSGLSPQDKQTVLAQIALSSIANANPSIANDGAVLGSVGQLSESGFNGSSQWLGALIVDAHTDGVTLTDLSQRLDDFIIRKDSAGNLIRVLDNADAIYNFIGTANDTQLGHGLHVLRQLSEFGSSRATMLHDAGLAEKARRYEAYGKHADRAAIDLIGSVYGGVDLAKGVYRIAVNGEHTVDNYVSAFGGVAGGAIGATAKYGSKVVSPLFRTGQAAETAEVPIATGFRGSKGFELVQPKYQPIRNVPGEVDGRAYSGHAFDQMQNRGIMPSVVDNTIGNGVVFPTKAGTTGYYDAVNKVQVIVNSSTGRVVTVIRGKP